MSAVIIGRDHGGQVHITDYEQIEDGDDEALADISARHEVMHPDDWWVCEPLCDDYERALRMAWDAFFEGNGVRMFDGVEEHGEMEDGWGWDDGVHGAG
ncbi:hypothetical protein [Streptomyces sp. NPDC048142]|uniref:hypothetical protein n=1 Tax=Streptomyces sp. NPDC048142 TaxID=3365501 RepID=UPI00372240C0